MAVQDKTQHQLSWCKRIPFPPNRFSGFSDVWYCDVQGCVYMTTTTITTTTTTTTTTTPEACTLKEAPNFICSIGVSGQGEPFLRLLQVSPLPPLHNCGTATKRRPGSLRVSLISCYVRWHYIMCIYIYIHIVYTYTCVYIYIQVYTCIYTQIYIHANIYIYIYTYIYVHRPTHIYIYIYMYTCIYIYIYMCVCIYIYTSIHIYIYIYMYIYILLHYIIPYTIAHSLGRRRTRAGPSRSRGDRRWGPPGAEPLAYTYTCIYV